MHKNDPIKELIIVAEREEDLEAATILGNNLEMEVRRQAPETSGDSCMLLFKEEGLTLVDGAQELRGDFRKMLPRIHPGNLPLELLVKAARIKGVEGQFTAIDATAGLGEDAFLLGAAGFDVKVYERDPIIASLLADALLRAGKIPQLAEIVGRMHLYVADSITQLQNLTASPDVVLLDPMFPSRQKSALIKKKFQMLQQLESPCCEEEALLNAALSSKPRKIVIKRPLKGPFLAGRKPDYTIKGKAIRYDGIVIART